MERDGIDESREKVGNAVNRLEWSQPSELTESCFAVRWLPLLSVGYRYRYRNLPLLTGNLPQVSDSDVFFRRAETAELQFGWICLE